jgi:hypothetical protein
MKPLFIIIFALLSVTMWSQELFSVTEPASNRAARSVGIRVDNSIMDELGTSGINYHLIPEIMVGISKKFMVSAGIFFSNRSGVFRYEGGSVYAKYRFLSKDAVQKHFRMASFGRISYNNSDVHQEEINMCWPQYRRRVGHRSHSIIAEGRTFLKSLSLKSHG